MSASQQPQPVSSAPEKAKPDRHVRAFGGYQPGLDGIRGLGMFAMLGYHAQMAWASGAFLSLSQFFTLSGFLITAILLDGRTRTGTVDLWRFWTRRFRRLAPAALLGLVGVTVFGATVATRSQAENLPGEVFGVVAYVVNWVFISTDQSYTDLFASPSPVGHYWSLAVEEQFYLVIPLVMFGLFRVKAGARAMGGLIGIVALVSSVWMFYLFANDVDLDRLYYGTDTRMSEVMIGALLAVVLNEIGIDFGSRVRRILGWAGVIAFGILAWMWITLSLTDDFVWQGAFQINAILTAVMIVAIVGGDGPLARFYGVAPLAWLGRMSYGVYIFHFPIFLWLTEERTGLEQWPLFFVRVGITLVAAVASQRFVERPIRDGATLGLPVWGRVLAYPVIGMALVGIVILTANTDGDDPLATLRDDGQSLRAPIATSDGVLDIVVIYSAEHSGVVDALASAVEDDSQINLRARTVFACEGGVVEVDGSPTCANWAEEWPLLIAEHDPDSVVLFVDDWAGDDLVDLQVDGAADARATSAALLATGFDLLSVEGASIASVASGVTFEVALFRGLSAYNQSLQDLGTRTDLNLVPSGAMPDPSTMSDEEHLERSAESLLDLAALYQRADRAGAPRVMIVGDSQARSLGYGIERWGADQGYWVWNVASNGCGLADEGFKYGSGEEAAIRPECVAALQAFERQVASFDPDMVIVFSSAWDLGQRRLDEWPEPLRAGAADFDEYLTREYEVVVDTLTAGGAHIVWMLAPCIDRGDELTASALSSLTVSNEELEVLNNQILPGIGAAYPDDVSLYDLDAVLCPGGNPLREADGVSPIRGDGVHFNIEGSAWFAETYGRDVLALGGVGN